MSERRLKNLVPLGCNLRQEYPVSDNLMLSPAWWLKVKGVNYGAAQLSMCWYYR